MDDVARMRRVERIGDLNSELDQTVDRQRTIVDFALQGSSFEQLEDEERPALIVSDFMDRADVRMVQRRRGARLAEEPIDRLTIGGLGTSQEFESDLPAEREVFAQVDLSHSATAQLLDDTVV
jgi:hypothetical protein